MDIQGYCIIKKDATTGVSAVPIDNFLAKPIRVMEFATDNSGVLVIDAAATGLAQFDMKDVKTYFKCGVYGEYITPPDLSLQDKLIYTTRLIMRRGGYAPVCRDMVVAASLQKGEFYDKFLFQTK